MFNKQKDKKTGLTDEEKKMADVLNEAIEKKQQEKADEDPDEFKDEISIPDGLPPEGRLAYNIADHLAEVTAERFSDMIDGMEMDIAKQIVRRLQANDAEALVGMLQEMFLLKGMVHAAEDLDILRDCEAFEESIYWRFQDTLSDQEVFTYFRVKNMIENCGEDGCSVEIRMPMEVNRWQRL